jgi:hypothetical protein
MLSFARLCFSAFNLIVITELAKDVVESLSSAADAVAGAHVIASLGQLLYSGFNWHEEAYLSSTPLMPSCLGSKTHLEVNCSCCL